MEVLIFVGLIWLSAAVLMSAPSLGRIEQALHRIAAAIEKRNQIEREEIERTNAWENWCSEQSSSQNADDGEE